MGSVPGWLLRHSATVEPYRSWDVYDPARTMRCFQAEQLASAGPTGTERVAQITLIARLDEDCPPGSRITLTDGRKGYASAVVHADGGGLPTPDHLQVAVQVAGAYGPAFGELVVVLRRTRIPIPGGAVRYHVDEVPYPGSAVRPLSDADTREGATRDAVVETIEVVLPPGAQVTTVDQIRVRGLVNDVDGVATEVTSSSSEARPGVKVIGKRRN